jgi:hypothetical protein
MRTASLRPTKHRYTEIKSRNLILVLLFLSAAAWSIPSALAQTNEPARGKATVNQEWLRVQEALRHAKPMPMPKPVVGGSKEATPAKGVSRFNPKTRKIVRVRSADELGLHPAGQRREGSVGKEPHASKTGGSAEFRGEGSEGISYLGFGDSDAKPATPPSPLYYPYNFPWNTNFRILGRWNVNGANYYWLCSASEASDFHVISAGHCVYNHDPTNNGSGVGAGFANEMWAWAAETDVVDPIDFVNWPDFPYGVAKMTLMTTYNAWIDNSDLNWDFSFITLDRRIGDHVGWMGREWGVQTSSLNFDGYPAETPYVPANNPYQYPGYDANNVTYYTCCRIGMNAYVYGGHSGGPDWRYDGTNRYVEGVNSTSDRVGDAEATQLTGQIESDLEATIENDQNVRPPTDLAQTIEFVFNGTSKGLGQTSTETGYTFPMTLNAFNAGYIDAGDTWADVYLTSDPNNVTSGYYIGTYDFGYLGTYQYTVQNATLTVPTNVAPGNYYVGWVLSDVNQQYYTDKNVAVITDQTMNVFAPALSSVSVVPSIVVGGHSATGTVTLSAPGLPGGTTVSLASSNSSVVHVPASIVVPAGSTSAQFPVTTVGVAAPNHITVTATYQGVQQHASLTVNPAALSGLTLSPTSIIGGKPVTGRVHLNGLAHQGGVVVALSSSSTHAVVPPHVTVPAGQNSAAFTIKTTKVSKKQTATIKAVFKGVSKTATLTIKP